MEIVGGLDWEVRVRAGWEGVEREGHSSSFFFFFWTAIASEQPLGVVRELHFIFIYLSFLKSANDVSLFFLPY
jgi:hypothetical protein